MASLLEEYVKEIVVVGGRKKLPPALEGKLERYSDEYLYNGKRCIVLSVSGNEAFVIFLDDYGDLLVRDTQVPAPVDASKLKLTGRAIKISDNMTWRAL